MLIPWGSDAPLYHWPVATVAMILANVLAFIGLLAMSQQLQEENFVRVFNEIILAHGNGLRPWQWITSNFMHGGIFHLLGNMFCLWGFGFVTEGKIGWWRFLLIYFGIGVTQCALEQTMMLWASEGGSLGASSIIYGLLAICMVWAPRNEMNCIALIFFRVAAFDIPLYALAILYFGIEILTTIFTGFSFGSSVLHMMGAGLGFGVGIVMLKKGWVDCEGWDLFNVWSGTENAEDEEEKEAAQALVDQATEKRMQELHGGAGTLAAAETSAPLSLDEFDPASDFDLSTPDEGNALESVREAIAADDPARAYKLYKDDAAILSWQLPESELLQIIAAFHKKKMWSGSMPAMVEYLKNYTDRDTQVRLKLAQILLEIKKQPSKAIQILRKLDPSQLSEKQAATLTKLRSKAQASADQGRDQPG